MKRLTDPQMLYDIAPKYNTGYFAIVGGRPAIVICVSEDPLEFVVYNEDDMLTWPRHELAPYRRDNVT